jgi:hypothetical protein
MPKIKTTQKMKQKNKKEVERVEKIKRFFKIVTRLPYDLQMVIINRRFGISRNSISECAIKTALYGLRISGFFLC